MRGLIASIFFIQVSMLPSAFANGGDKADNRDFLEKCAETDPLIRVFVEHKNDDPDGYELIKKQYRLDNQRCEGLRDSEFRAKLQRRMTEAGWECSDCNGTYKSPSRGLVEQGRKIKETVAVEPARTYVEPPPPPPRRHRDSGGDFLIDNQTMIAGVGGLLIGGLIGYQLGKRSQQNQNPYFSPYPMGPMPPPGFNQFAPPFMPPGGGFGGGLGGGFGRPGLPNVYNATPMGGFPGYGGYAGGFPGNTNFGYGNIGYGYGGGLGVNTNLYSPNFQSPIFNAGPAPFLLPYR